MSTSLFPRRIKAGLPRRPFYPSECTCVNCKTPGPQALHLVAKKGRTRPVKRRYIKQPEYVRRRKSKTYAAFGPSRSKVARYRRLKISRTVFVMAYRKRAKRRFVKVSLPTLK